MPLQILSVPSSPLLCVLEGHPPTLRDLATVGSLCILDSCQVSKREATAGDQRVGESRDHTKFFFPFPPSPDRPLLSSDLGRSSDSEMLH